MRSNDGVDGGLLHAEYCTIEDSTTVQSFQKRLIEPGGNSVHDDTALSAWRPGNPGCMLITPFPLSAIPPPNTKSSIYRRPFDGRCAHEATIVPQEHNSSFSAGRPFIIRSALQCPSGAFSAGEGMCLDLTPKKRSVDTQ